MNLNRRHVLAAAGIAMVGLSGCITEHMYKQNTYWEQINGFFANQDGSSLVILGQSYHYVFAAPPALRAMLAPALHGAARDAEFEEFEVEGGSTVTGKINLELKPDLDPAQQRLVESSGFVLTGGGWKATVAMKGTRYSTDQFKGPASQKFRREYIVSVTERSSAAGTALKVAATPVTVLADGALILGTVVLFPVLLWCAMAQNPCLR
ncbi:hypothetical protein DFR41_11451 [Pseudacidovorax intermedius]|uniref:5-formyltetrahydrofolate cyclo-ligase n=1 Tax=Pseudacidovorax intermedius TaxID=433924 RepID=A0A370F6F6_9BURK|nr:hypothetical protein [Pseudacidovorax intermedius]RDI18603.1 hypothetical protein DFR41_11451 [Pseudacidovorax intermedius]